MNILVLDDEPGVLENLRVHLTARYSTAHSFTFASGCEECLKYTAEKSYDLFILDIRINGKSCIDFFSHLSSCRETPEIIFITGYPLAYCEEIFNGVRPLGYLKKPLDYEKLFRTVDALESRLNAAEKTLTVKYKGTELEIPEKSICFAESSGRLIQVHCRGARYEFYGRLKSLSEELPGFIQCHTSFLVNPKYISLLEKNSFTLFDGTKIPISRKYCTAARERFFREKGGFQLS